MKATKIVFYGDSITDMNRDRNEDFGFFSYGVGYPNLIAAKLTKDHPDAYKIYNRGISGDRVVDLYARIKRDVWNLEPDVLSILIGINDVWHELETQNGVDIVRFEKIYRMIIEETKERLPNIKIMLCEPFVLKGKGTVGKYNDFLQVRDYAKVVKKLADEYGLFFLPLQQKLDDMAEKFGAEYYLSDGVHRSAAGAELIAENWLDLFDKKIKK